MIQAGSQMVGALLLSLLLAGAALRALLLLLLVGLFTENQIHSNLFRVGALDYQAQAAKKHIRQRTYSKHRIGQYSTHKRRWRVVECTQNACMPACLSLSPYACVWVAIPAVRNGEK
jgi:hypothetical protein